MNTARLSLVCLAITVCCATPAEAQLAVVDASNVYQSTITATQEVNQTLKQIEQYQLQLQQFQNEVRNVAAPAVWVWDLAEDTVATADRVAKKLDDQKALVDTLRQSLSEFGTLDYYRASPCYNRVATQQGCGVFLAALEEQRRKNLQTQNEKNEALYKALDDQHKSMTARTKRLQDLYRTAQGAPGAVAAIQYGNQLTSAQIAEEMELRSMLITQQNLAVEQKRQELIKEAEQSNARASFYRGADTLTPPPPSSASPYGSLLQTPTAPTPTTAGPNAP